MLVEATRRFDFVIRAPCGMIVKLIAVPGMQMDLRAAGMWNGTKPLRDCKVGEVVDGWRILSLNADDLGDEILCSRVNVDTSHLCVKEIGHTGEHADVTGSEWSQDGYFDEGWEVVTLSVGARRKKTS